MAFSLFKRMRVKADEVIKRQSVGHSYIWHKGLLYLSGLIVLLLYFWVLKSQNCSIFVSLYNNYNISSYLIFWPSLDEIISEIQANGDYCLSSKYYVFSITSFSSSVLLALASGLAVSFSEMKIEYNDHRELVSHLWRVFWLAPITLVIVLFVFNDAGYDNLNQRFPINPKIGLGEIYFARDIVSYFFIASVVSSTLAARRLLKVSGTPRWP